MLAYVFWHWPVADAGYVAALLDFHRALAAHPPPGFRGSRVLRMGPKSWLGAPSGYEDWYFVDDFTAIGALNDAAIAGPRQPSHDIVAARAAGGTAAIYGHLHGHVARPRHASFRSKPSGVAYPEYLASLPRTLEVWQRKMVLGPAPEFALFGEDPFDGASAVEPLYPTT